MLCYSNRSIHAAAQVLPSVTKSEGENVTWDVGGFKNALMTLLVGLRIEAAAGGDLRKFATGSTSAPNSNLTIFALVQCTPDLSQLDCNNCLSLGSTEFLTYGKDSGRFVHPSCNLRFGVELFFGPATEAPLLLSPLPSPISPPPESENTIISGGKKSGSTSRVVVIVLVPTVVSMTLIIYICNFFKGRKIKGTLSVLVDDEIRSAEALQFDFGSIKVVTDNFSETNKLGQGGFGVVYKGRLLNEDVAVKRLSKYSSQGDLEFKNEVSVVARLQHRNLVRLLGFCIEGNERLLVYEFVPNASLDKFVFDPIKREHLDWGSCYKIIVGIGRGLLYLHEDSRLRVIHSDLKASNILLDTEMNPKIADFGMARLFVLDQTQGETNRIVGTYGYMAPEYAMHGQFSIKFDVYSFGVLTLEIIIGHKNSSFRQGGNVEDLLNYVWKSWREGETASNLIDPAMRTGSRTEIMRCLQIGLLCVQQNIVDRPTMASIILMLTSNTLTLPEPSQPFSMVEDETFGVIGSNPSRNNSVQKSENEASITELCPR